MNSYYQPTEAWTAAVVREAARSTVVIPAFSHDNDIDDISGLLADYALNNTGAVSIILPLSAEIQAAETFALCVRFNNAADDTIRYILHNPYGNSLLFPTYASQNIGANATFEIWSIPAEDTAEAEEDLSIELGELTHQGVSAAFISAPISGTTYTLTAVEV